MAKSAIKETMRKSVQGIMLIGEEGKISFELEETGDVLDAESLFHSFKDRSVNCTVTLNIESEY